jgi:hypothetical protein
LESLGACYRRAGNVLTAENAKSFSGRFLDVGFLLRLLRGSYSAFFAIKSLGTTLKNYARTNIVLFVQRFTVTIIYAIIIQTKTVIFLIDIKRTLD